MNPGRMPSVLTAKRSGDGAASAEDQGRKASQDDSDSPPSNESLRATCKSSEMSPI